MRLKPTQTKNENEASVLSHYTEDLAPMSDAKCKRQTRRHASGGMECDKEISWPWKIYGGGRQLYGLPIGSVLIELNRRAKGGKECRLQKRQSSGNHPHRTVPFFKEKGGRTSAEPTRLLLASHSDRLLAVQPTGR